jgi:orotate phosphoribosyltransferase
MSKPRDELLALLMRLSVRWGPIVLSSGRESDFYVDAKQTLLHPDGMALTGTVLVDTWQEQGLEIDAVGGPTLGADPMTCAFVLQARRRGTKLPGFFIRKEPKGHGTMAYIEGIKSIGSGSRVLVLEDVITTGGSAVRGIQRLREVGMNPVALFCLVDRLEGARETIEAAGVPVVALFTRDSFPKAS